MGLRSRATLVRASVAAVVVAAVVGVGLTQHDPGSAEPTVYQFLLDWQSRQYLQAARLTTGAPRSVATELAGTYQQLDASNLTLSLHTVSQQGNTAYAEFDASINLGTSGLNWSYQGNFRLVAGPSGWRVRWSPSVIVPGMTTGERLAVATTYFVDRAAIDGWSGQSLMVRSLVYQVGVYPDQLTDPTETANRLAKLTGLPAAEINGQIEAAISAGFFPLLTLSPVQWQRLGPQLELIPGIRVVPREERLFDSIAPDVVGQVGTELSAVLRQDGDPFRPGTTVGESGLEQTYQRQLAGTPETDVVLLNSAGRAQDIVHSWPGQSGKPVDTTIEPAVQRAADRAVTGSADSAAIVAVQPSTGKILAVASNDAAGQPAINPLAGQYEPGQAFTIVSSAALLSRGLAPDEPVPCRQRNAVNGRYFFNDPPEQLLGASFGKDFASACATAFAGLSQMLSPAELDDTATMFGIGGWQLPVSDYFAGQIGQSNGQGRLAADVIGIGGVRVSPLDMALAAAVVDSGRWHSPSLVRGLADASKAARGAESPQILAALRGLMRSAALHLGDRMADQGGNVYAQAGNAPFGRDHLRISWFVGYQGNIAFAVVRLSTSASASAALLAGSFLQNLQAGS